ncbi:hypothetical protein ACN27G_24190 [Plantactinospora sp. WMMB334]|uniref:hypothetical protein n=1 Tax=Plantactinospora sp. WMMB334 TaxID=3404119 RepID=UPI003B93B805
MAERKKLLLRLDPQVYDAIAKWAGDDLRSVNAQIEYALRLALRSAGRAPKPARGGSPAVPTADTDGSGKVAEERGTKEPDPGA